MRQVLDIVEALERTEMGSAAERQIVWRLTEAHTNSPPFTVTAEAFPANPTVSVGMEAVRVARLFATGLHDLLEGGTPDWLDEDVAAPLKRVFQRNMNGIGRTEIVVDGEERLDVVAGNARAAAAALERFRIDVAISEPDYSRTEYGALEAEVYGLTRWNDKPALLVVERLSRDKITCVLTDELAERLGPSHKWREAWEGNRLLISGKIYYSRDGSVRRIEAQGADDLPWTEVSLSDMHDIDIVDGRSVSEHLRLLRGDSVG